MLTIKHGDIIAEAHEVDAVVNAANDELRRGGGVSGAIFRAAGTALDKECEDIGHCDTGNAVVTKAYNMPCRYIIHAVGPIYDRSNPQEAEALLYDAYTNAIERAKEYGIKSVAFPLISAGIYGMPKTTAFEIAQKALNRAIEGTNIDARLIIR